LLINAAKYTDAGGQIRIDAEREAEGVVIRVIDNGVGIAPDLMPRLFDAFVQSDRAPDRAQGGLGIGLTIAKSRLDLHGGVISARSGGVGCGSEFTVRLPAAKEQIALRERSADHPLRGNGGAAPARVLLVDDNRDAADALADALRELGYVVDVA